MSSSQGQQKKNVVLSGGAMKEMAKQAKANREERRLTVGLWFLMFVALSKENRAKLKFIELSLILIFLSF